MSVPSWARKGVKVVCIKVEPWHALRGDDVPPGCTMPIVGDVCTITATREFSEGAFAKLAEHPIGSFNLEFFRPLVDAENDAETEREIYRRKVHQNTAPVKELEPAE